MSLKLKTGSGLASSGLGLGLGHGNAYAVTAATLGSWIGPVLLVIGGVFVISGLIGIANKDKKTA